MHKLRGILQIKEDTWRDCIWSFSNERTESSAELTMNEAREFINWLNAQVRKMEDDRQSHENKMRMAILANCHTMRWYVRDEISGALFIRNGKPQLDMARIDKYCQTHTAAHKRLNDLNYTELQQVVFQFQQMAKNYLKKR